MSELHIASFIVMVRPEREASIVQAIQSLPQTEVVVHENGRIVLVMEGEHRGEMMDRVDAIQALDGVITVNLVYHHAEEKASLEEELPDDYHTT
jgi:periplasmic nitrate reductase NapD